MKRFLVILMAMVLMVSTFTGCTKTNGEIQVSEGGTAPNILADTVEDSSELPDWTGKKLELQAWYGAGTSSAKRSKSATQDVVTPEIYRVTGVKFSDESFDNGGQLMDAKISRLIAANDWPDVLIASESAALNKMIDADMVYDLTELIPKYMPHLDALMKQGGENSFLKSTREDGKIYELRIATTMDYAYPDFDPTVVSKVTIPKAPLSYVYIRDDILKKIKPDAMTYDELTASFMEKGGYTKEEILNASFNSKEEFFDFLYKVKEAGFKVGTREVYPIAAAEGIDNWALFSTLGSLYGYNVMNGPMTNYFTYYDGETDKVEYMFKQPFFKEILKDWTKLVQDDVASQDSLIDNRAAYEEKANSGQYAVLYGGSVPNIDTINSQGFDFKYRKVFINIPYNDEKFPYVENSATKGTRYAILKKGVSEEDLPQVLRFFDFMMTDVAQKLTYWGPRSAGLFTEENGVMRYTDAELEANAVYDEPNDKSLYYGLADKHWPGYPMLTQNKYNPKYIYDFKPNETLASKYYTMATIEPYVPKQGTGADIWNFDSYGIDEATRFWSARMSFEEALTKILIANNNEEFEKFYAEMISVAERNGLTDEALEKMNKAYAEDINKDYMHNLK